MDEKAASDLRAFYNGARGGVGGRQCSLKLGGSGSAYEFSGTVTFAGVDHGIGGVRLTFVTHSLITAQLCWIDASQTMFLVDGSGRESKVSDFRFTD